MLKLKQSNVVFSTRDLALRPEVHRVGHKSTDLAKQFFDADLDRSFKSTIVEARLFLALYRSFEQEIEDTVLKESIIAADQLH